jgi:hypothetical protein
MLLTRRIYVDSRHASGDSKNFLFALPEQVQLPRDTVCYIENVNFPHSFFSCDETNQNLYLIENSAGWHGRMIPIPISSYDAITLRAAVELALNQAQDAPGRVGKVVAGTYSVVYDAPKNRYGITLTGGGTFRYMSAAIMNTYDGASDYSAANGIKSHPLASCDDLLGLTKLSASSQGTSLTTGHIDVRNYHNLYLHSSTLTGYHSMGPMGVRSVLARIPVHTEYGQLISKQHSALIHDYVDCGALSLRTLQFSLRDGNNREVDLRGGNISFTLLFCQTPIV